MRIDVEEIDTEPEADQRNPLIETESWILIDCEAESVSVYRRHTECEYTQAEFADRKKRRVIDTPLGCRPDEEELADWLASDDGQLFLCFAVDAEYKHGGAYEPASDPSVRTLLREISELPESEMSVWVA